MLVETSGLEQAGNVVILREGRVFAVCGGF